MNLRSTKFIFGSFAFALSLGSMACTVETRPAPPPAQPVAYADNDDAVDYDETGPVIDVNTYPHEVYGGRNVYYVNNRWYYRDGNRWAHYRNEPRELNRRRTVVREAPRAHE